MDMPEKIAAWRFIPEKADEWIHGGWSEDHDHKTTQYTRSDLAVEVKPLAWVEEHDFHCSEVWDCDTILGLYSVFKGHDQSAYSFEFESGPDPAQDGFEDIDAAKAAAQADYNARILSALTTRPDDLRPKLQALIAKWEGMTCRTKCAEELREVLEGGV